MMSKHLNGRSVILSLSPSAEGPGTPRIHERKLLDLLCPSAVYTQRTGVSDMLPRTEELLIVEANHLNPKLCNLAALFTHRFVFHPKGRVSFLAKKRKVKLQESGAANGWWLYCRCKPFVLNVAESQSGWCGQPGMRHNGHPENHQDGGGVTDYQMEG